MALPDLVTALSASIGNPAAAAAIAQGAIAALGKDGGPFRSFISVAEAPEPDSARTSDALLGCVFSVKDNVDQVGFTTTCGSRTLENAPRATKDAWIVAALKAAGAVSNSRSVRPAKMRATALR
jgi:Asp-tRNA(Asn)/Glu-tRNA(Gln) amidotransferase A subunit family amidase